MLVSRDVPMPVRPADAGVAETIAPQAVRHVSLTVLIPTKNEERNIGWVLRELPPEVDEIIIVDGLSTDRTLDVVRSIRPDARIVLEQQPGKGAAVRAGLAAATGDIIVMLDADCSMDPAEVSRYAEGVVEGYDLVKGSRFLPGGGTDDMTLLRRLGNWALVQMVNTLYRQSFSELCYGYMAFRRNSVRRLNLQSHGFEIETEIVTRSSRAGHRILEVPSFEGRRRYGNSNLNTMRDGWRVFKTILRERVLDPKWRRTEPAEAGAIGFDEPSLEDGAYAFGLVPVLADEAEERREP